MLDTKRCRYCTRIRPAFSPKNFDPDSGLKASRTPPHLFTDQVIFPDLHSWPEGLSSIEHGMRAPYQVLRGGRLAVEEAIVVCFIAQAIDRGTFAVINRSLFPKLYYLTNWFHKA